MNKASKLAAAGGILAVIGGVFYYLDSPTPAPEIRVRKEIYNFDVSKCPGEAIQFKMLDPYLRGLVEIDTTVDVVLNAFNCETPQREQVVLYRFSEFDDPVLRRVVGIPGDKFSVIQVEENGDWQLKINGKFVVGAKGEQYRFGSELPPPLKLAEESRKGVVGKDEVILFSSFPPGDRDSGTFGIISTIDIVGKAIVKGLNQ